MTWRSVRPFQARSRRRLPWQPSTLQLIIWTAATHVISGSSMEVPRMDEQLNLLGATIFWLYILFALILTATIIETILEISPSNQGQHERRKQTRLFAALALISFTTLSYNMLNVLIQSYTLWARQHGLTVADTSIRSIWTWSITSTLFQDFGEAIVQNSARYLWAQTNFLATLCVCLFMGIEGRSHARSVLFDHADEY